jgi:SAM-dependent methyltransferase
MDKAQLGADESDGGLMRKGSNTAPAERIYTRIEPRSPASAFRLAFHRFSALFLWLPYFIAAWVRGVPGARFRWRLVWFAIRNLPHARKISCREMYRLVVWPMDSVRYFEFDFASRAMAGREPPRYLDVSSPRFFPLLETYARVRCQAVLLNPDKTDLSVSRAFVQALGMEERCQLLPQLISESGLPAGGFQFITCLSVLEHIPDDREAVMAMWRLLSPGGRLIVTVPCAAAAKEEFVDQDGYGLLDADEHGFYFFQRFYDDSVLAERIFPITGHPRHVRIYGEIKAGNYSANIKQKMIDPMYPLWREPYTMAREYAYFDSLPQLPGIGVIALEFEKPKEADWCTQPQNR